MKIGLLVPHIFMQADILPQVIFSPGKLGIQLADDLAGMGGSVTLFTPGAVPTKAANITANLSYFEKELNARGDNYLDLLRKHPFTFVTLARQVQTELVAKAIKMANDGEFDILHVYTNEEDIALPLAQLCSKPIVFTHHDPYNFLVKYKSVFPKYPQLNWISMSRAQRQGMPANTNWVGNIYHGLPAKQYKPVDQPSGDYVAYMGRIINTKGVHLAIMAVQKYNSQAGSNLILKIAGKHYAEHQKDTYWQTHIKPYLGKGVEYLGYIKSDSQKQEFLGNAKALLVPSLFEEPFGLVMIEALACGAPIIGLNSGAIPEVVSKETGMVVDKAYYKNGQLDQNKTANLLANAIKNIGAIDRRACREEFEERFTADRMAREHLEVYRRLVKG